jgi:bifunctional non-homologous end joining protein LigD
MPAKKAAPATLPDALLRKLYPPMLATLAEEPPAKDGWAYEMKYDGFRCLAAISGGRLAMRSRNDIDLSSRFPRIAEALSKVKEEEVVLDGEIVALDEQGTARFQLLQQSAREMLFVFDILWRDGEDLRRRSYDERRRILTEVLRRAPAGIRISEQLEASGAEALARARADGAEGIIAKRRISVYEPRRSREWLKIKVVNEQEFAVIGWNPSTHSSKEIGSLHLAVNDGGALRYAGKVGTGFTYNQRVWWKELLSKDVVPVSPAAGTPRERAATWVTPRYVVQVSFTEWTADNRLRHPSLLGVREDKRVEEVVRERPLVKLEAKSQVPETAKTSKSPKTSKAAKESRPAKASKSAKTSTPAKASKPAKATKVAVKSVGASTAPARSLPQVTLTHPERLLYPKDNFTKQDVADYYAAVAEPMLRALRDRPLSLEHWNKGIHAPSWFHQHLGKEAPSWLTTVDTPTRVSSRTTVKHLVADSPEALRWLAQMSVLTVHMWASRAGSLNEADWLVFDLDPAKGKGIEQAIDAAIIMRGLLEHLEVPSVPKTSGKRGIHVFVPLAPGYSHEEANAFACSIAAALAREVPWMTVERSLDQRKGRLYLDCMQNAYGKTVVAPYSPRAIDGAPVSAPLKWDEVTKKLDPLKFNLRTMPNRLAKVGDLFASVLTTKTKLPALS